MAAATEGKLGELHNKMAQVMGNALDQVTLQQQAYDLQMAKALEEQNPDLAPAAEPNLNPALLSVIARFLDSNKITCVPEAGNTMGDLERKLAAKRERKALKVVGGISHTDD
ncbi:terminase small subunit protein [Rhizobium phage RHEph15]|uniref:Terminase small subunit protein n=2 Tax=Tepoztlanvirus TaxID=3424906 RepID=A0A7S5QYJ2_9CAUD|nr:terminase small subunit protein [Rhizobium phage RHph_TM34]QIG68321.1 terminase small subunit protein [Rhizobium phage RHph_Y1_20]QIG69990.1 terminase small subunit protein [Rhizobium phage RHph_Y48]QIG70042.1 terminase small subunit protein [Rhizobium phage RHph_Y86]QIG70094.1 terminase small subunit protein [Rhizobium phage RHph_Y2_7]QXV74305.1 terminase small subunit protein [Rhizobium phage RHEph15]QXV74999.1 terminase small subunit protein [Rhizobium phage RHEph27]